MISLLFVGTETAAGPAALLPVGDGTLLEASMQRLARLDAPATTVVTDGSSDQVRAVVAGRAAVVDPPDLAAALQLTADVLATADSDVALLAGDLLLPDEAIAELLLDPRRRTSAAVSASVGARDLRRRGGQIVSAGSTSHRAGEPDAAFAGALQVAHRDLAAAADAVREMGQAAARGGWSGDPLGHVLVALVRRQVAVAAVDLDPWPWWRPAGVDQVAQACEVLRGIDPGALRLARALRPDDGFYSTFVVRRLSRRLTPLALRWGLRPNQVTVASLLIGLTAAASFAAGGRVGLVAGALLLQLSLVVDCVDGEVARYTRAFTSLGAWLDASTDRVKEYACYAGLAIGATGTGTDVWLLAAAMLTLQTTRHTTDYTFTLVNNVRESALSAVDLEHAEDDGAADDRLTVSAAERAVRASRRSNERAWVNWAKKVIHLPIGERWLVISLVAAVGTPRLVFAALLGLGLLALAYTTAGRVLRARTWADLAASGVERDVVRAQLDRGPLAAVLARVSPWELPVGRYAWTVPPLLRLLEYAVVVAVVRAVAPDATAAAFALLFAVAYHHYDALYRVLNGLPHAGAVHAVGLGVEGRLIVVLVLTAAGPDALSVGLVILAAVLAVLFVGVGTTGGLRALRAAPSSG